MPTVRSHASWLRQVESYLRDMGLASVWSMTGPGDCLVDDQKEAYLKDTGMTGLASAWVVARRRLEGVPSRWTRRRATPAYVPMLDLT